MTTASIHPMGEPRDKRELVGERFEIPTRVHSNDYGSGKIVADFAAMGIQIYWDKPVTGTKDTHLMVHDRDWVGRLEKLPPERPIIEDES